MDNESISKHHLTPLVKLELFDPLENGGLFVSFLDEEGTRVTLELRDTAFHMLAEKVEAYSNQGQKPIRKVT